MDCVLFHVGSMCYIEYKQVMKARKRDFKVPRLSGLFIILQLVFVEIAPVLLTMELNKIPSYIIFQGVFNNMNGGWYKVLLFFLRFEPIFFYVGVQMILFILLKE